MCCSVRLAGLLSSAIRVVIRGDRIMGSPMRAMWISLPPGTADDGADLPPAELVQLVRDIGLHFFPGLEATRTPA